MCKLLDVCNGGNGINLEYKVNNYSEGSEAHSRPFPQRKADNSINEGDPLQSGLFLS